VSVQEIHLEAALARARQAVRQAVEEGRNRLHAARTPVLAVTSGKGGVGKSNISLNLAISLARQGRRVCLLDADLGLASVEVLLGSSPSRHLGHVLAGECSLDEAVYAGPAGLSLISGGAGLADLASFGPAAVRRVMTALEGLSRRFDLVMVDTGAGISPQVLAFVRAADHVLLVTTPEPTAIADAYAMIKAAGPQGPMLGLIMNQAGRRQEAEEAARHLAAVSEQYLGVRPVYLGYIPDDPAVPQAVRAHEPLVDFAPGAPAARAIIALAGVVAENVLAAPIAAGSTANGPVAPAANRAPAARPSAGFWRRLLAVITEDEAHG